MKVTAILNVFVTIIVTGILIGSCYNYDNKIDSVIERAQVSADREDMLAQLTKLKKNMEELDMTSGHFALLWKTPENDLGLHYKVVTRLIERLNEIKDIPKSDTAYQTALDDIRGTIRELPNPGTGMVWVSWWWLVVFGYGFWLVPLGLLFKEEL